jgi:HlyD family secretion protein
MPNTEPIFSQPASRRARGGKSVWIVMTVLLLGGGAVAVALLAAKPAADTPVVRGATIAAVAKKTIRDIVSVSGVLELSTKDIITAPGGGVVAKVLVAEGDVVVAGQELLRIETSTLEQNLADRQLDLEKLLRTGEQADAERKFSVRQSEMDIASAERSVADAQADLDKANAMRVKLLASDSEVTAARNKVSSAQTALEQVKLKREQSDTLYAIALKNREADLAVLRQTIAELKDTIAKYVVRAPHAGTVYSVGVEAGKSVQTYAELAQVADPTNCRAALDVPETRIASVSKGMVVTVYVGETAYPALVDSIAPSATTSASAGSVVRVTALFQTKPAKPTIGASVSGEIVAGTIVDALVLPRGPFLSSGNYTVAYVVSGGSAVKKAAVYGIADGSFIQVKSGLAEGDRVIVSDYRDFIHLDSFPFAEGN